jgi:predicted ATPase/transcriptional regulator with XRE-family HTH domain
MPDTFADLLYRFRVAASLTQEALADRCRISPDTIAALEQGKRRAPRLSTVALICDALGLRPAERAMLAGAASGIAAAGPARAPAAEGAWRHRPLPSPLTPLFGRHTEVEAIAHELASERLVTLVGTGGVGKTRLALAVAEAAGDKFEGGTWWVELGPVSDPHAVPAAVLAAVGGAERPGLPVAADQITGTLPAEPTLLVIDNCEHVVDAASELIAALLRAPSITILTTTREPLAIPGEIVWPVPPLPVPEADVPARAEALADTYSVQLFIERASRVRPGFGLTDDSADAIARICRRLEGIPLAIELTAARVRSLGVHELADELDVHLSLEAARSRGVPERQSTLWASISWSYRLLTEHEQVTFRCLACFAGPFSIDAIAARRILATNCPMPGRMDAAHASPGPARKAVSREQNDNPAAPAAGLPVPTPTPAAAHPDLPAAHGAPSRLASYSRWRLRRPASRQATCSRTDLPAAGDGSAAGEPHQIARVLANLS